MDAEYYSSDEEVAWGPLTLKEIKRDLKDPRKIRRRESDFPGSSYHTPSTSMQQDKSTTETNTTAASAYFTPNESIQVDPPESKSECADEVSGPPDEASGPPDEASGPPDEAAENESSNETNSPQKESSNEVISSQSQNESIDEVSKPPDEAAENESTDETNTPQKESSDEADSCQPQKESADESNSSQSQIAGTSGVGCASDRNEEFLKTLKEFIEAKKKTDDTMWNMVIKEPDDCLLDNEHQTLVEESVCLSQNSEESEVDVINVEDDEVLGKVVEIDMSTVRMLGCFEVSDESSDSEPDKLQIKLERQSTGKSHSSLEIIDLCSDSDEDSSLGEGDEQDKALTHNDDKQELLESDNDDEQEMLESDNDDEQEMLESDNDEEQELPESDDDEQEMLESDIDDEQESLESDNDDEQELIESDNDISSVKADIDSNETESSSSDENRESCNEVDETDKKGEENETANAEDEKENELEIEACVDKNKSNKNEISFDDICEEPRPSSSTSTHNGSLVWNDTMDEMKMALKDGLGYKMPGEEDVVPKTPIPKRIVTVQKTTGIPQPVSKKKTPNRYDYLTSPVGDYIKRKSPIPENFKLPQKTVKRKPQTPNPNPPSIKPLKDIVSPVGIYIKNSPRVCLKQNVPTKTVPLLAALPVADVVKPDKENFKQMPQVMYKPGRKIATPAKKEIVLPPSIKKLVPEQILNKHEKKVQQNLIEKFKNCDEGDVTIDNSLLNETNENMSFIKTKQAFIN